MQVADAQGVLRFSSIFPGAYSGRWPHIHFPRLRLASARNMAQSSLGSDMVFRDGTDLQLATVSGSTSAGYVAKLVVGV